MGATTPDENHSTAMGNETTSEVKYSTKAMGTQTTASGGSAR